MRSIFDDDPLLLGAFRAGEDAALAAIYRGHSEAVGAHLAMLARATGAFELAQPSAVADLLQEVFARAFSASARRSYDERRPYGPYLNAIAKNCFVDLLRKRRRDLTRECQDPASLEQGPGARDDDECERALLTVVETYVSGLSAPLRDVYEQRFAVGLTQKAACDALGISRRALRTAETHLKRGARDALLDAGLLAPCEAGCRSVVID
jgi:RNA polymerase sigma factor (sigma-70 family)